MEKPIRPSIWRTSQASLRWAAALASCRHGEEPSDELGPEVNTFDLFVGLLLAHPDQSEPKTMLEHFRLTLGQVLPEDYKRPDAQALEQNLRSIPDSGPQMDKYVREILEYSESSSTNNPDDAALIYRPLFLAMLETDTPFRAVLEEHIKKLGSTVFELRNNTEKYFVGGVKEDDYAELLRKRHPIKLSPIELPSYQSDHGREADLSHDLVGIRAEVDAFAYLLGSRDLKPPLAIGLFGDWGSGKSFFMEAVENRISGLTESAREHDLSQKDIPFWKHIVQIRFNAWHYVEGNLWASLVEHIFNQLKFEPDENEGIVEQRRQYWTKQIAGKRGELAELESDHREKEKEQQKCQMTAADLTYAREQELQNLERLESRKIAANLLVDSLDQAKGVLKPHFEAAGIDTFGEAIHSIQEAKRELRKGIALFRGCTEDRLNALICVAALILAPLLIWGLQTLDLSPFTSFSGKVAVVIASIVEPVRRATRWVRKQRMRLQEAETQVRKEITAKRKEWDAEIEGAVEKVNGLAKDLDDNRREQASLTKELAELEEKRDSITAVTMTNEFIAERTGSDDYRSLLGLPALIQRDFLMLSRLVNEQNSDILEQPNLEDSPHVINRIILYIDDLDRCPDEHVIKVLQAVHLLLAFDLFVVVVAVDARWLHHALVDHYPVLVKHARTGDQPTADDYLEKIFQIPFWIEPLVDDAKRKIVSGLLRAQVTGVQGSDVADESDFDLKIEEAQQRILHSIMDLAPTPPLSLKASDLSVPQSELDFLDSLAPVLGGTPRSVKRFVNLYQLLRIIHQPKPEDKGEDPSDYEILALILAIGNGLPRLASPLFCNLPKSSGFVKFIEAIEDLTGDLPEETKCLLSWLEARTEWLTVGRHRVAPLVALAQRFLFRVGKHNRNSKKMRGLKGACRNS